MSIISGTGFLPSSQLNFLYASVHTPSNKLYSSVTFKFCTVLSFFPFGFVFFLFLDVPVLTIISHFMTLSSSDSSENDFNSTPHHMRITGILILESRRFYWTQFCITYSIFSYLDIGRYIVYTMKPCV